MNGGGITKRSKAGLIMSAALAALAPRPINPTRIGRKHNNVTKRWNLEREGGASNMRLLVLYYSGTGNTRFACDVARIVLERAGHNVTLMPYKEGGGIALADFDAYCFAAPVYEWAPARNAERFAESMPRLDGKCAFILTSSAGAIGQATALFARALDKKGLAVLGDYNLICPDSWGGTRRWSYKHDMDSPTVESVRELADFVDRMLSAIVDRLAGKDVEVPRYHVVPSGLFWASRLSRLAVNPNMKMGRKKVDELSCTQCGVCEENCPVDAIKLAPYPAFGQECIACWRCINTCPEDSITTRIDCGRHYRGITRGEELLKKAGLR